MNRLGSYLGALLLITVATWTVVDEAYAMTVSELRTAIGRAADEAKRLAGDPWNNSAEQRLVERIDRLADGFHELASDGVSMPKAAKALLGLCESTRRRYTDVLESIQAEIIRVDGDLEAAQDSAAWRERELLAMRLLYRLNWLRYETAMRYETSPSARKALLTRARTGFSEFLGSGDAELTVESLLGHGLAAKALKDYAAATGDFRAALAMKPNRELTSRLRVPLVEALLSSGRVGEALSDSAALLADATRGELRSQALFLRAKALLLALRDQSGTAPTRQKKHRSEAARVLEELYGRSRYWKSKVVQLIDSGIDSPRSWHGVSGDGFVTWLIADSLRRRGECDVAHDLYDTLLEREAFVVESRFGLGSCAFRESHYRQAIEAFNAYFDAAEPADVNYQQAAYLRFKAGESLYLQADETARSVAAERYLRLLHDFLAKAPSHRNAFEAWYRLGEWHRDKHEYVECAEAFVHVKGQSAFEIKASFLSGQCYVEAVLAAPDDREPPAELVTRAVAGLDRFLAAAESFTANGAADRAKLVEPLAAKAVVMAAAVCPRAGTGTMQDRLARLSDFEQRFPSERALLPEVYSLRIVAYRSIGKLDMAGSELEKLLSLDDAAAYRGDSLKKLGIVFLNEAAKRDDAGEAEAALRSRKVALRVYERLLEDARTAQAATGRRSLDAIERLVADLRAQVSGS